MKLQTGHGMLPAPYHGVNTGGQKMRMNRIDSIFYSSLHKIFQIFQNMKNTDLSIGTKYYVKEKHFIV